MQSQRIHIEETINGLRKYYLHHMLLVQGGDRDFYSNFVSKVMNKFLADFRSMREKLLNIAGLSDSK